MATSMTEESQHPEEGSKEKGFKRRLRDTRETLERLDSRPRLVKAAQGLRSLLPGDSKYGDPLSVSGKKPAHLLGQRIADATAERPSAFREMGMGALQVWQSFAEAQGRGRGDRELAIVFTDLAEFSEWTLKAGDDAALELLREVSQTLEPAFERRGGRIVKRVGDGLMATFEQVDEAVAAALEGAKAVAKLKVDGHRPRLRAGIHVGRPRKLGGDYFGADVNVAARVAEAAEADQVLVSETVRERLESGDVALKRRWRFKEKGAPRDLKVFHARGAF